MSLKRIVLAEFFSELANRGVGYCVLRNFENLAEQKDIDILCNPGDIASLQQILGEVAVRNGWWVYSSNRSIRGSTLRAVRIERSSDDVECEFLEIDIVGFVSLYFSKRQLQAVGRACRIFWHNIESQLESHDDITMSVPSPRWQYLFLVNRLAYKDKPKYRNTLAELEADESVSAMLASLNLGPIDFYRDDLKALERTNLFSVSRTIHVLLNRDRRPTSVVLAISMLLLGRLKSLIAKKGVVVTFSGPDGAGKTTMNESLIRFVSVSLGQPAIRLKHFYFLNRLLGRQAQTFQARLRDIPVADEGALERDRGSSLKWKIRRMLGLILIVVQYPIGRFMAEVSTRAGYTVIVDTSFLDAFVKGHRPVFPRIERVFVPLFPLGDVSLLMVSDPRTIVARKPELSESEIEEYYSRIRVLASKSRGEMREIRTDVEISETLAAVYESIASALFYVVVK